MKYNLIAASVIAASVSSFANASDENSTSGESSTANEQSGYNKNIVITANRISQDVNDVLADIEVIDRAEIERLQPRSFVDLLESVAGVEVIKRGGHGQNSSMFVRGSSSDQTLILIDGVRVGSATLGEKALSTISVSQINSIEIVKGPRAAIWGSDAIGGVIQIFTRRYATGEHSASITTGSNGEAGREASFGFGSEDFNQTVTYAMRERDGIDARIDDNDDEDGSAIESYALRGDYQLGEDSELDWVVQKDRTYAEFDTSFGGDKTRTDIELINLRFATDFSGWDTTFTVSKSKDESATFDQTTGNDGSSVFITEKSQFGLVTHKALNDYSNFAGGLDWYKDDVTESTTTYAEGERTTKSFFAGYNYDNGHFLTDLTIRNDDVEGVDKRNSSNLGLGYRLSESHLFSVNYAEGFKAPSFNDLYHPWGGNDTLKFETSENLEILYKGNWQGVIVTATLYKSDVENLIQWAPTDGVWAPENVGEAKLQGGTFDLNYTYAEFTHGFNLSIVEPEDKQSGTRLIRRSRIQSSYDLAYAGENFDWSMQINHVGNRIDDGGKLPSYTRINMSAGYRFNQHWSVNFKINDLFDKAPTEVFGYHPLEQEYFLTVTHQNLF